MKIAISHDWLISLGGGEKSPEIFHEIWPEAPLYTLVYLEETARKLGFNLENIHSSFLQKLPFVKKKYRFYLPFFPLAIEQLNLSNYDIILSSSHAVAKGVLVRSDQLHICYCHTPIRYAWDLMHQYLKEGNLTRGIKSIIVRLILHYIRMWDVSTASRVDYFLTNSHYTAQRIWRTYRRKAEVIYGPVDVEKFTLIEKKENYFIFISRLVPYKRADLVINTFNQLNLPLIVVGEGPELNSCKTLAQKNIQVLGYQSDNVLVDLVSKARALIFPAEEDFGLVPVEAQACGTPVIAYGKGGVKDTIIPANGSNWYEATGVFFYEQTKESLKSAIDSFLKWENQFNLSVLRMNAEKFSRSKFKKTVKNFVEEKWDLFKQGKRNDYTY